MLVNDSPVNLQSILVENPQFLDDFPRETVGFPTKKRPQRIHQWQVWRLTDAGTKCEAQSGWCVFCVCR